MPDLKWIVETMTDMAAFCAENGLDNTAAGLLRVKAVALSEVNSLVVSKLLSDGSEKTDVSERKCLPYDIFPH